MAEQKHIEFEARFNAIDLYDPENTAELEALAEEAHEAYAGRSKSLFSGFIAASCRFELGETDEALEFYQRHLAFITKNPGNPDCVRIYARFARMLSLTGQPEMASDALAEFTQALAMLDPAEALEGMSIHGLARRFDRLFALKDLTEQAHPEWIGLMVRPIMLEHFIDQNQPEELKACFLTLASAFGYEDLTPDSLDEVFNELEEILIHPRLHPELSERETRYLAETREIMTRELAID